MNILTCTIPELGQDPTFRPGAGEAYHYREDVPGVTIEFAGVMLPVVSNLPHPRTSPVDAGTITDDYCCLSSGSQGFCLRLNDTNHGGCLVLITLPEGIETVNVEDAVEWGDTDPDFDGKYAHEGREILLVFGQKAKDGEEGPKVILDEHELTFTYDPEDPVGCSVDWTKIPAEKAKA